MRYLSQQRPHMLIIGCIVVLSLFTGCSARPEKILQKAESAVRQGDPDNALKHYLNLIDTYPQHPLAAEALLKAGTLAYYPLRNTALATELLAQVPLKAPTTRHSYKARSQLAAIYEAQQQWKQAAEQYSHMLQQLEQFSELDGSLSFKLGECYFHMNDWKQARLHYEQVLTEKADNELQRKAMLRSGQSFYYNEQCKQAVALFKQLRSIFPDTPQAAQASIGIGDCLAEQGKLDQALQLFQNLLNQYPNPSLIQQRIENLEQRLKQRKNWFK